MANRNQDGNQLELWYETPAKVWEEALPIGNGRIGAMVFGGLLEERIQLNEDTIWSGGPKDWNNPQAPDWLDKIRKAIFAADYVEADRLCLNIQGPFTQSYLPLGDLFIVFDQPGQIDSYRRSLDMNQALSITEYLGDGCRITRTVFASYFPAWRLSRYRWRSAITSRTT